MLKNLLLPLTLLLMVLGCSFSSGTKTEETSTAESTPAEKFAIGDVVVARWTGNSFYEGTIESKSGSKITVKWNDGSKASDVDKDDVYAIPTNNDKPDVSVGDMVLAKVGSASYWNGAEITSVGGGSFGVKTVESGQTTNVDANKIIVISAATAANLKDKAGSNDFLKEAHSKKPDVKPGFKPRNGERVLAQWTTNSWWSGKVNSVKGGKATIAWEDGSKPSEVAVDKTMAYPKASTKAEVSVDQYVLAKPASGSKWGFAKVASVSNTGVEIKDAKGATRTVKQGEYVPLK